MLPANAPRQYLLAVLDFGFGHARVRADDGHSGLDEGGGVGEGPDYVAFGEDLKKGVFG